MIEDEELRQMFRESRQLRVAERTIKTMEARNDRDQGLIRALAILALTLAAVLLIARHGWAQVDQIPPSHITWVEPELSAFSVTTSITSVQVVRDGFTVTTSPDKLDGSSRWPDAITPGWNGPLEYSVGLVVQVGGRWYASAPIEYWHRRGPDGTGPIQDQTMQCPQASTPGTGHLHCNWWYSGAWSPLDQAHPQPGEQIGVFVASGDVRNHYYGAGIRERSNVVLIALPNPGESRTFTFDPAAIPPIQQPPQNPSSPPVQVPTNLQTDAIMEWLRQYQQWTKMVTDKQDEQLEMLQHAVNELAAQNERIYADLTKQHQAQQAVGAGGVNYTEVFKFLGKYVAPAIAALLAGMAATN